MIQQVMVAFDKKARAYLTPFFVFRLELGVRNMSSAVNGPAGSPVADHPEDFALYHLGAYDDESGLLDVNTQPVFVTEAIQLKKGLNGVQHKVA